MKSRFSLANKSLRVKDLLQIDRALSKAARMGDGNTESTTAGVAGEMPGNTWRGHVIPS